MIGTTIIEPKRGSSPETIIRELLVERFGERERKSYELEQISRQMWGCIYCVCECVYI